MLWTQHALTHSRSWLFSAWERSSWSWASTPAGLNCFSGSLCTRSRIQTPYHKVRVLTPVNFATAYPTTFPLCRFSTKLAFVPWAGGACSCLPDFVLAVPSTLPTYYAWLTFLPILTNVRSVRWTNRPHTLTPSLCLLSSFIHLSLSEIITFCWSNETDNVAVNQA